MIFSMIHHRVGFVAKLNQSTSKALMQDKEIEN